MGGIVGVAMETISRKPSIELAISKRANLDTPLGARDRTPILSCLKSQPSRCIELPEIIKPPDKSAYWKINFLISQPKHMLRVLKRTVSMRRFF